MNDDTVATPSGPAELESRLRRAMTTRAGREPVSAANWGDLAGRLAAATHRRQRLLAGAAALALVVGAAGGYFGEAAASTGATTAARAGTTPNAATTTVPRGLASPSLAGPSSGVMCPGVAGTGTGTDSGLGSATPVFTRTTSDGVTVRVYRLAAPAVYSCMPSGPRPLAGVSPGSSPVTTVPSSAPGSGAPDSTGSTTTTTTEIAPIVTSGSSYSLELSDAGAVGQGALSSPLCVIPPGAVGATGSGSSATGKGQVAPEPVNVPATVPPITTTTSITATTTAGVAGAAPEPQQMSSGAFGVVEGDPVWWVAVQVGSDVTSVHMTFADGSVDQMAPVGGIAVVAHHVSAATASADAGPFAVRGTLELIGATGGVVATLTLPQTPVPSPVPVPLPAGVPDTTVPANTSSGGSSSGSASSGSVSSGPVSPGQGSAVLICPQPAIANPPTQP